MTVSVMLVDDVPAILTSLTELIERSGLARVVAAESEGKAAISTAVKLRPELILIDVSIPGMSGIEITRELIEQWPQARILAISAHAESIFVRGMLDAGARGYLLKDNLAREIKSAIRSLTGGGTWIGKGISIASA